jgi:hypothetical protein
MSTRAVFALSCVLAWLGATPVAQASPWTLPEGKVSLSISGDLQFAQDEFRRSAERVPYPLAGRYTSSNLRFGARYGITDRTEVSGSLILSSVSFAADEVFLPELFGIESDARPDQTDGILSIDRRTIGVGDLRLALRHRFTPLRRSVWAAEAELKLPTGYDAPEGVFSNDNPQLGVADDVTLGDGQTDLTLRLHFGAVPARNWFVRADAGLRVRFFGPGQQAVGGVKTGVRIADALVPYVWADGEHTFTEGDIVGTTFLFDDPDIDARDVTLENFVGRDYRLDRTVIRAGGGFIIAFGDRELDVGYGVTVWGRNTGQIHSFSLGTTLAL